MEVALIGGSRTVPEDLRRSAQAKVAKLGKIAPVLERAEIRFVDDPLAPAASRNVCEVTMDGHGHTVRARASGRDPATCVDEVVHKLEHQVERLKGKLIGRSRPHHRSEGTTR